MHVGMTTVFQNPGQQRSDRDAYREELRLADLAEPYEEAEDNIRLFAREVMPELQKLEPRTAAGRVAAPTEDRVNVGLLGS